MIDPKNIGKTLFDIAEAVDKAWLSPSVQEARRRAHGALDALPNQPPIAQAFYWIAVAIKMNKVTKKVPQDYPESKP